MLETVASLLKGLTCKFCSEIIFKPKAMFVLIFNELKNAYIEESPLDSDTLSICKITGSNDRLNLSCSFSSKVSVPSLQEQKIHYFPVWKHHWT